MKLVVVQVNKNNEILLCSTVSQVARDELLCHVMELGHVLGVLEIDALCYCNRHNGSSTDNGANNEEPPQSRQHRGSVALSLSYF